jgi:hypothetical protein
LRRARHPSGKGEVFYGSAPYGWRLSTDRSKLVRDRSEQRVLAVVRRMYLERGLTMEAIVERLRAMRIANRRGAPFSMNGVRSLLHDRGGVPLEAMTARVRERQAPGRSRRASTG